MPIHQLDLRHRGVRTRGLVVAAAAALLPGCSLLFDAGEFQNRPRLDVKVIPNEIFEGQGSLRKIPVVLEATNIEPDAQLDVQVLSGNQVLEGVPIEFDPPVVSGDGILMGTAVSVGVIENLAAGSELKLRFTITRAVDQIAGDMDIVGLNELDDLQPGEVLFDRYSRITLGNDISFGFRPEPIRLVATSSIEVTASVDVSARGTTPGAGGCNGGRAGQDGACGPGGGHLGTASSGGGGGGGASNGETGTAGVGDNGGAPGSAGNVDALMIPLASARGNGGGGGADSSDSNGGDGGDGGGGGGLIELTSEGQLILSGAAISAEGGRGADGKDGTDVILGAGGGGGGGGGGGSGGGILLRALQFEVADELELSVAPGAGGAAGEGGSGLSRGPNGTAGGAGGSGQIRIDYAEATPDLPDAVVNAPRGAMWQVSDLAPVTQEPSIVAAITGGVAPIDVRVNNTQLPDDAVIDGTVTIDLNVGRNELCVLTVPNVDTNLDEAKHCLTVVYIPR